MATPGGGNKGGGAGNKGANPNKGGGNKGGISPAFKAYLTGQSLLATPKMTLGAARALTNLQIQGPYTALSRQIAQNNRQSTAAQKLSGGYFTQFGQQAQQGVTDAAKIAGDLQTQLQGINTSTQSQLADQGQQAQQSIQSYTPGSPAMSSPAMQSVAAEIARQAGLATQQGQNALTSGALQSGNYSNLAASQLGTGALAATEQLGQIAQAGRLANQPLTTQQATLLGERGPLMTANVGKLVQQGITNAITEQGLSNTKLGILTSAKTAAAARAAAATNARLDRQARLMYEKLIQRGETQRAAAAQAAAWRRNQATIAGENARSAGKGSGSGSGSGSGTKPLTTNEQASKFSAISEMQALIRQGEQAGHPHGQISQALQTGSLKQGFPVQPLPLINAAFELVNYGYIWPHTARALQQMGLQPRNHGLKVQKPPASSSLVPPGTHIPGAQAGVRTS